MPGTLVIPLTATQIFLEIIEVDGSSGWSDYRMKGQIFSAVNSQPKNKGCKEKTDGVAMRISEEFINYYTAKMVTQPVLTFEMIMGVTGDPFFVVFSKFDKFPGMIARFLNCLLVGNKSLVAVDRVNIAEVPSHCRNHGGKCNPCHGPSRRRLCSGCL